MGAAFIAQEWVLGVQGHGIGRCGGRRGQGLWSIKGLVDGDVREQIGHRTKEPGLKEMKQMECKGIKIYENQNQNLGNRNLRGATI